MTIGTIQTSILTDIANAIRFKAGVATLYRPGDMAAAVLALDGTDAGGYVAQPYKALESGVISDSVFEDIADAIRAQNGLSVEYEPGEMAAAILALTWDVGYKCRALLLSDGTLEFNYLERRRATYGSEIVDCWEVDAAGYSSESARPWHASRGDVTRVVFHDSYRDMGPSNGNYFFAGFSNMTSVHGFDCMRNITTATQMFTSCTELQSIYADSYWQNNLTSASAMFYGCRKLVGGTDGKTPDYAGNGVSICKLGAGGVLTDPMDDRREWFKAFFYADGHAVITRTGSAEAGRELLASGLICASAHYQALGFAPWDSTNRSRLTSVEFGAGMGGFTELNLDYLLYSCSSVTSVTGLGNLGHVHSMRYAFSGIAATELDFCDFDPSELTDLFYCFSGCDSLETIYADAGWELPSSGISGSQCFYSCGSLVGGAGTAYSSSQTEYQYFRIDAAGAPGYLTVAP